VAGIILIRTLSKRDYHQNCMTSKASVISGISETKKVKTFNPYRKVSTVSNRDGYI